MEPIEEGRSDFYNLYVLKRREIAQPMLTNDFLQSNKKTAMHMAPHVYKHTNLTLSLPIFKSTDIKRLINYK